MASRLRKIIESIENYQNSFWLWLASFSGLIVIRILIENWLMYLQNRTGLYLFYEFTHTFLFFLIAFLLILGLLNKLLKVDFKKAANVLLYGYLIVITPPIIDHIISGGKGFWSFYIFDSFSGLVKRFFTFFGDRPDIGITYGVRVEVALAVIFLFIYGYIKSKNIFKSLYLSLISYTIFFVLGTFPSWITIATNGFAKGFFKVTEVDVAQMFLTPAKIFSREIPDIVSSLNIKMSIIFSLLLAGLLVVGCWLLVKEKFITFLQNIRPPQIIFHLGFLCVGVGLALIFTDSFLEINLFNVVGFLVLLLAVCFAWLASVIPNDIADWEIDKKTNPWRPLPSGKFTIEQYKVLGWSLFAVSVLFSAIVNFKIALLLLVYQSLAWIYSSWPLRLKRFAYISSFTSSLALLMILFSGFILISPSQNVEKLPVSIIILIALSYTLSIPLKDFKDIEGDKKYSIYTVPVLFGEYWGKVAVSSGIFISYLSSIVFLNEPRLFWWALIFGGISFWLVYKMKAPAESRSLNYRNIFWWIFGLVFAYGLILVKILFL